MTSDVRCLACHRMVYLPAHCGKCGAALPELVAKPEPVKSAPLFATPPEAAACLRKYIEDYTDCHDPDWQKARAALESLEAEVGRLTEALALVTAPPDPPTESVFRFARRSALNRIRTHNECTELGALARWALTLESELAEKTARVAELEATLDDEYNIAASSEEP